MVSVVGHADRKSGGIYKAGCPRLARGSLTFVATDGTAVAATIVTIPRPFSTGKKAVAR
jgi:hypothetical protein